MTLRESATPLDDAAVTRRVQDLLDPLSIAALEIGADGKLEAMPALNELELRENHPRTAQAQEIGFECLDDLTAIRLSPPVETGKIRIAWSDLEYAHGDGGDWTPMRMTFKTVK